MFTTKDYQILKAIIDRNDRKKGLCISNGTTIKEIITKTSLSDKKIRETRNKFIKEGFITEGLKNGKEKTYILTEQGFTELNKIRKNIFGEV